MGLREIGDRLLGIYSGRRGPPRTADRLNSVPDTAVQEDEVRYFRFCLQKGSIKHLQNIFFWGGGGEGGGDLEKKSFL